MDNLQILISIIILSHNFHFCKRFFKIFMEIIKNMNIFLKNGRTTENAAAWKRKLLQRPSDLHGAFFASLSAALLRCRVSFARSTCIILQILLNQMRLVRTCNNLLHLARSSNILMNLLHLAIPADPVRSSMVLQILYGLAIQMC